MKLKNHLFYIPVDVNGVQQPCLLTALRSLSKEKLPVKTSFEIMRMIKEIDSHVETYNSARNALIVKHGEETSDGKVTVTDENFADFVKELSELNEIEVDVQEKVKFDLGISVSISISDLALLEPVLDFSE